MKSVTTKKILMFVLSLVLVLSTFIGLSSVMYKAKALDSRTTDVAVYNEAVYKRDMTRPFWNSNIIYNETVFITLNSDGTYTGNLLYPAVQIISVTNHDGTITYTEGEDFSVSGNTISAINARLPHLHYTLTQGLADGATEQNWADYLSGAGYYNNGGWQNPGMFDYGYCTYEGAIYTEGYLYRTRYLQVTYVYKPSDVDTSFLTKYDANYLGGLRTKLENGQDINMVSIGDSITEGCSSTGDFLNVPPYQPCYTNLVEQEIERVYGVNVNHVRLGVGGTMSDYLLEGQAGRTSFVNALANNTFDFAIIAYGMNDQGAARSGSEFEANIRQTVNELLADSPDCNVVFINTFPRNPSMDKYVKNSATRLQLYQDYKAALDNISSDLNAKAKISRVVNMYAVGTAFLNAGKVYAAISSSNNNHPNDSFIRVYAMNVMSTICNYDMMSVYEMNKYGYNDILFPYKKDANGWNTLEMDTTNMNTEADNTWWQNRPAGWSPVISRRFGPHAPTYNAEEQRTSFYLVWDGHNVNFNAFDVSKPITFKYNVSAPMSNNSMFYSPMAYAFSLHATLEDAFISGTKNTSNISTFLNTGVISLLGTNGATNASTGVAENIGSTGVPASELFGKLRVNGNAEMTSDYFFIDGYNESNYASKYYEIEIKVGETYTTIAIDGKVFATLNDVNRSSFPNGVAYLKVASKNNALFNFVDPDAKPLLYSSVDNSLFPYNQVDENGWSRYLQNSAYYKDSAGNAVAYSNYGKLENWVYNDYSGMTLVGNAYVLNYKKIDINAPFKLTYLVHPDRTGDYVFALFDDIKTAFLASSGAWNGPSVGAKIWMRGANTNLEQGFYDAGGQLVQAQLNNHLLFNSKVYYSENIFSTPYTSAEFAKKPIEVIFDIGETATNFYVDNVLAGTVDVKRSDFSDHYVYMSVACCQGGTESAILAKAIETDVEITPVEALISSADGSLFAYEKDENGWATYIQTPSVTWANTEGETIISGHYGKYEVWNTGIGYSGMTLMNNAYVANYNAIDVSKPIQFEYMTHWYRSGDYTFALFDNLTTALKAGNGTWNGANGAAKIWMRGTNTNYMYGSYQLNSHLLFNDSVYCDEMVLPYPYTLESCLSKSTVILLNIMEDKTQVFVDGNYYGSLNVKRSDFSDGVAYLTVANAWSSDGTFSAILAKGVNQNVTVPEVKSKIASASVTLNSGITFNAKVSLLVDHAEPQVTFTFNGSDTLVTDYVMSGKQYVFSFNALTPQYMNRGITMVLTVIENGNRIEADRVENYSLRDYAESIIKSEYALESEKTMAVDLLNYGAIAQLYTKKDVTDLANKNLTESMQAKATQFNENDIVSVHTNTHYPNNIQWGGTNLVLGEKVAIRYSIAIRKSIASDLTNFKVVFSKAGGINVEVPVEYVTTVDSKNAVYVYATLEDLTPVEFKDTITATVYQNGVATSAVSTYSVNSWIKAKCNSNTKINDATEADIARALYTYGLGAYTYVDNVPENVGDFEVEVPRDMNGTSSRTEIVTENNTLSFSDELWQTPESLRAADFDLGNAKGYFLNNPIGENNKFFVYVGVPTVDAHGNPVSETNKVPGMVLVHGYTGTAFYEWVDYWVARGYAAIAMCTDANIPNYSGENASKMSNDYHTTLSTYQYGGQTFNIGPDNGGNGLSGYLNDYELPLEQQWGYNAIAKVIISNSFLRSFEGVDTSKIGITGISYGSFLTCQVTGYDDRFACAVPVYGAFCQDIGDTIFSATVFGDKTSEKNALYNNYKLMEDNNTPFLFVNSNKDMWFSPLGASMSNKLMKDSKMLLINGLQHGHTIGAFEIPEILTFIDSICLGKTRLPEIVVNIDDGTYVFTASAASTATISAATIYYTDSVALNEEAVWYSAACTIVDNKITIPKIRGAYYYYVNVTDSNGMNVSTRIAKASKWTDELLEEYLRPYWASNTMFNETGAFIGETGSFNLLYTPTEITMVGQYNDTEIQYVEGVDYTVSGNVITRLAGSRMPYWKESEYFLDSPANVTMDSTMTDEPYSLQIPDAETLQYNNWTMYNTLGVTYAGKYIPFTNDGSANVAQNKFITVSYEHNGTLDGLTITDSVSKMTNLHNKFDDANKDTIQVLVIGESVGEGCSSSGTKHAGYVGLDAPDAYDMIAQYISKHENKKVVVTNVAKGGTQAMHWVEGAPTFQNINCYERMIDALRRMGDYNVYGVDQGYQEPNDYYDLVLIRMGGNDGGISETDYKNYYTQILNSIFTYSPNANLIAISPFTHNELCPSWGVGTSVQHVEQWQKDVHASLQYKGQIGTADVWSATKHCLTEIGKYGKDFLTNNINHANDFVNRWFAQLSLYAIYGDEFINSFN